MHCCQKNHVRDSDVAAYLGRLVEGVQKITTGAATFPEARAFADRHL